MPLRVLVIAPPGPWRDSLRVLLQAHHRITDIDEVADIASGQIIFQQHEPNLILLDASLKELSVSETVRMFQTDAVGRSCLILTHSANQEQAARSAGASVVLPEGFSTTALYEALSVAASCSHC